MLNYPVRIHTLAHSALMFIDGDLLKDAPDVHESLKAQLKHVNDTGAESPWGFKLDIEKGWIDVQILPTRYGGLIPDSMAPSFQALHKYVRRAPQQGPAYLVDLGMDERYILEYDATAASKLAIGAGEGSGARYFVETAWANRATPRATKVTSMRLSVQSAEGAPYESFTVDLNEKGKEGPKWEFTDFNGTIIPSQAELKAIAKNVGELFLQHVSDDTNFHFPRTWETPHHRFG